ncbi:hypothetical protein CLV75_0690 [Ruegeria conchae]|uniref:Uncharacterized protein n=1 Tax=Ruegeria conchae TaxID=981384 RepID=A0A497ZMS8_9RHOB|nr:hypothetical protein CLV75_0690 [Ruegeria conchae]
MFAYREMQLIAINSFFQLEFASEYHKQQTLNGLPIIVTGKQCQKI